MQLRSLEVDAQPVEDFLDDVGDLALVDVDGLDEALVVGLVGDALGRDAREVRDVDVDVRPVNLAALRLAQQTVEVGLADELLDLDLAHVVEVLADALQTVVVAPTHKASFLPRAPLAHPTVNRKSLDRKKVKHYRLTR